MASQGKARTIRRRLDTDADGRGWFVDPTPMTDEEFVRDIMGNLAGVTADSADRVDLLTVLAHELGHILGYDHDSNATSLMDHQLPVGVRRLALPPAIDSQAAPPLAGGGFSPEGPQSALALHAAEIQSPGLEDAVDNFARELLPTIDRVDESRGQALLDVLDEAPRFPLSDKQSLEMAPVYIREQEAGEVVDRLDGMLDEDDWLDIISDIADQEERPDEWGIA